MLIAKCFHVDTRGQQNKMVNWGKLAGASWRIRHLAPQHSKLQQMLFSDEDFAHAATTDRHTEHQEPPQP